MRLIDADALKETLIDKVFVNLSDEFYGTMQALDEAPTIDAVPRTQCKDCQFSGKYGGIDLRRINATD